MRGALLVVALIACDSGEKKKPPEGNVTKVTAEGKVTVTPTVIMYGRVEVTYDCHHSNLPWSKGGSVRNMKWDLMAKTLEVVAYEYGDPTADPVAPEGQAKPHPERKPVVTPLSEARAKEIGDAVLEAVAGGSYKPEHPVPEGTPCTLTIRDEQREWLKLEKAYTKQRDAASDLVIVLTKPS
jgi:hypothetical protein